MGQNSALRSVGKGPGKSNASADSARQRSIEFEGIELVSLFLRTNILAIICGEFYHCS
jgi:hypothetical protein